MAVLSRGYKRKSNGFILANQDSTPDHIGDEPKQIDIKFPNVKVAVDGNRVRGIKLLQEKVKNLNAIILDDAFQHRYVDAGLKILLTPYDKLYIDDFFLPTGSLRESKSGSKRADIIVVTKTSKLLSPLERRMVRTKLSPQPYQKVFFSYYHYNDFVPLFKKNKRKY